MTQIKLPKEFTTYCEALQRNPEKVIEELINQFLAEHPENSEPNYIFLQDFIPPIIEALDESINSNRGPFRAKYYPPPQEEGNVLWFHLTSVLSWWKKTNAEALDSPHLKKELHEADYIIGPKAINIAGKATWCYGFEQPLDNPILPLPENTNIISLEWTETHAPKLQ